MSQDSDSGRSLSVDRRTFLGMVGGASAAAAAVGASGGGNPEESLSIGGQSMPINEAYQIAQNYYAGPESARPAAADAEGTIWEVTDAGSNQKTRRTISDGSSWLTLNVKNEVVETEDATVDSNLTLGFSSLTLGENASQTGDNDGDIVIGGEATSNNTNTNPSTGAVLIGYDATADSADAVCIGASATSDNRAVSVGKNSSTTDRQSVAVGNDATSARIAVALGDGSDSAVGSVTVGSGATATSNTSIVIGRGGTDAGPDTTRIETNQIAFGGTRDTISDADLNNSELTVELDETNSAFRLRGKDSGGVVREATIAW